MKPKKAQKSSTLRSIPIVGLGASAGGLEALETFFLHMPPKAGLAFVIIQHLSPKHKSILGEILKKDTQMKVMEVQDGIAVESNCVYFNPPDKEVGIFNGIFHLMEPPSSPRVRMPIDYFFRSLAKDQGERSICIILSGTGSDGTLGLQEIKGVGGMTMAQAEFQAKYPFMPKSAIDTGRVDCVLPVEQMPQALIRYIKHPYIETPERTTPEDQEFQNFVQKILLLVRTNTRHDFTHYKSSTIRRRIERRMAVHKINHIADYYRYLQENLAEIQALFKDLIICVTSFFRDPEAFEILETKIIPQILESKPAGSSVRVWVPGCGTGEEALSLAILFNEVRERLGKNLQVQIFATDIDAEGIERARLAEYPESISAAVSPERHKRFFTNKDGIYKVNQEIREMVVFAPQNLISDPPFSKLDLVSCRNVLIYLNAEVQKRVLSLFHFSLNPGGYLFLGPSESIGGLFDYFAPVSLKWKIYQSKGEFGLRMAPPMPPLAPPMAAQDMKTLIPEPHREMNVRQLMEKIILEQYSPACVLVNAKYDILYFHGATGKYLTPPMGEPSFNILKMAHADLRHKLASALHQAVKERKTVVSPEVQIKERDHLFRVDLLVRPLVETEAPEHLYLVVFEEKTPVSPRSKRKGEAPAMSTETHQRLINLEQELQSTKEYLQTTIEEWEAANEELKSSNEELQSTNEELQSTNEELETAKEELQSTNEELVTVNSELQTKIDELTQLSNDTDNLLASTAIGTIFLDRDLGIKHFTPSMTALFNLIPTDIGRSLRDITSKINYDQLYQDAEGVLITLQSLEKEVQAENGKWFNMRILPYRTRENVIDGVVITFVDITDRKRAEQEIQAARTFAENIVDTVREPLLVLNRDLWVVSANRAFYKTFQTSQAETENRLIFDLGNRQWDIPQLHTLLKEIIAKNIQFEDFEMEHEFPTIGWQKMLLNARQIQTSQGQPPLILLALENITTKK
jgi:two-component system, chemotaxis family, CheB/CheR fusion protein